MSWVIACLNPKGGSGKTTITVNLAGVLAEKGYSVTVIDLDPQRSAARWADGAASTGAFPGFELSGDVIAVDLQGSAARMDRVKREIEYFLDKNKSDIVLLDNPPEMGEITKGAAQLADLVLIPTSPSPLDLWDAGQAVNMCRDIRAGQVGYRRRLSLVPSRLVSGTILSREISGALENLGEPVAPGISNRVVLVETVLRKQVISTYAAKSAAHAEFLELAGHVIRRLER